MFLEDAKRIIAGLEPQIGYVVSYDYVVRSGIWISRQAFVPSILYGEKPLAYVEAKALAEAFAKAASEKVQNVMLVKVQGSWTRGWDILPMDDESEEAEV